MSDLVVGNSYRLTVRSDSPYSPRETIEHVEYQGELQFWFPSSRANSITTPVPCFIDRAKNLVIPIQTDDILEVVEL